MLGFSRSYFAAHFAVFPELRRGRTNAAHHAAVTSSLDTQSLYGAIFETPCQFLFEHAAEFPSIDEHPVPWLLEVFAVPTAVLELRSVAGRLISQAFAGAWHFAARCQRLQGDFYNVLYKRAAHISELRTLHYSPNTILNCHTTILRTNDNYIRSS